MRFKVGNKVRVVNPHSGGNFYDGDIVEIAQIGDGDFDNECYGAISPHDNIMWFLYENEVMPATVADGIRAMSDEELAKYLTNNTEYQPSAGSRKSWAGAYGNAYLKYGEAVAEWLDWLRQPMSRA